MTDFLRRSASVSVLFLIILVFFRLRSLACQFLNTCLIKATVRPTMAYIHAYGLKLICIIRCIASIAIVWSHTEIDDSLFIIIMIIAHVVQKRKKKVKKKY